MAHKDVRILFTVQRRNYEAVGFLDEGEDSCAGDEMLRRTAVENGGAIGEKDEIFLWKHRAQLSKKLNGHCLFTGKCSPGDSQSQSVSGFCLSYPFPDYWGWSRFRCENNVYVGHRHLILRRLP